MPLQSLFRIVRDGKRANIAQEVNYYIFSHSQARTMSCVPKPQLDNNRRKWFPGSKLSYF